MPRPPADPALPPLPVLGVDFGERRIGLAISDPAGRLALPLATLARETDRRAIYRIAALAAERDVGSLAVGEPRLLDGRPATRTERIRRFAGKLARAVGRPLYLVEETLSTHEADARLRDAGQRPAQGDPRRDCIAAQVVVEDALTGVGRRLEDADLPA